ncbi:MAG: response regulator, partial [Acidobacteriota bacterium]
LKEPDMNSLDRLGLAVAPVAESTPARARPIILVADDNADNRDMMQVLLGLKGYEVIVAENGREAVEVALAKSPNLILLDLELPLMDGISVARNLLSDQEFLKVPIVVVSGHDPRNYGQAALEAGCTDFLLKPISFDRLDEILQTNVPIA